MEDKLIWTQLNYGPPGSGKSHLGWTASQCGWRVLHFDLGNEAGQLVYPTGSTLVRVLQDAHGDGTMVYEHMVKHLADILDRCAKGTFDYDLVILDSLDILQSAARGAVIAEERQYAPATAKPRDDEVLDQKGYGKLYLKLRDFLAKCTMGYFSFYATATAGFKQDPTKPRIKDSKTDELLNVQVRPDLEGRLASSVERFFDLVSFQAFDETQGWKHRIFLREQSSPKVKNRYDGELGKRGLPLMPQYMDNPTWDKLVVPVQTALE